MVVGLSGRVVEALRNQEPQLQGWVFPSDRSKLGHIELAKLH
jgi:hypothetical protein